MLHLVAHLAFGRRDLADPVLARRVWDQMRRAFPQALAGMVMPDHSHLMAEHDDPEEAREKLGHCLSRATYGKGRGLWLPVPAPEVVEEAKLRRVTRYVLLNPCRKGLVGDPLEWTWTTYRDVVGAVGTPWVPAGRLQVRLGYRSEGFAESFHRYVTSDNRVRSDARPLPQPAAPSEYPAAGLDDIRLAVAASRRMPVESVAGKAPTRRLFVALAREQGWRDTRVLAEALQVDRRTVQRADLPADAPGLAAARLCLGAERLVREVRKWPPERPG